MVQLNDLTDAKILRATPVQYIRHHLELKKNVESSAVDVAFVGSVPKSLKPSILFDRDYPIAMQPWKTSLREEPQNASNCLLLGRSGALSDYT